MYPDESDAVMTNHSSSYWKNNIQRTILMIAILGVASVIGFLFSYIGFHDTNIVIIYLLAVLITVWYSSSFFYGLVSSIFATFLFYYLFAEPLFAFAIDDTGYIITFIVMTFAALITSVLASHAKRSAITAQEKETETKAIYNLTNQLSDAKNISEIARISVSAISEYFSCSVACLCFDENGKPEHTFTKQISGDRQVKPEIGCVPEIELQIEGLKTGSDTQNLDEKYLDWPINGRERALGIICVPTETAKTLNESQMRFLRSMITNTALAMDRFWTAEQRIKSREEIVKERYRVNLLRAISHDIRTPISGIIGTSEMIIGVTNPDDPRYDLARGIKKDADWLHSLVENILNLTRLQDGKLVLQKQLEAVEEVIGEAINHIAKRAPDYEITACVPDELILVPMDAKLIIQAIINLLDNAIKHTTPDKDISITVALEKDEKAVYFTIKDSGSGINENDLSNIFELFYTSNTNQKVVDSGVGLGLVICETIIKAHGGSIEARNRTDGPGFEVVFMLPIEDYNK